MRCLAPLALLVVLLVAAPPAAAEFGPLVSWGEEGAAPGRFGLPNGIAIDNGGSVWVVDRDHNRIQKFTSEGELLAFPAFRRRHRSTADGRFNLPYDIAADPLGNLYVADVHNHRIQQFAPDGRFIRKWGSRGLGAGQFNQPRGLALDPFGNVWVADHENKRVQKFTRDGRLLLMVGANGADGTLGSGPGEFNSPAELSADAQGNVYVADDANHRVVKLANDGRFIANFGLDGGGFDKAGPGDGQFSLPYDTAVDLDGHVWVADTKNNRVVEIDPDSGRFLSKWGANGGDGTAGTGLGEFDEPYNVAVDCAGNVYVSDEENHRVVKLGDPSFPAPVCPPRLTLRALSTSDEGIEVEATCDRPCRLSAVARGGPADDAFRLSARSRTLRAAGPATLRLRLPSRLREEAEAETVRLVVTAAGAPGAERSVTRRLRLR